MKRNYYFTVFITTLFLSITNARAQTGYIIKVDGDKIYMNLSGAKVSDVVPVFNNGGSMTDPRTGRNIQTEPEVVGQIKIIAVQGAYSVGRVYGNPTTYPAEGMTVGKGTTIQKDDWGEVTVMIAPAELNFPKGLNNLVENQGNEYVDQGYIGDYVSAALMPYILKSGNIQLIDSSVLGAPQQNQNGDTYSNQAANYAKEMGAHYMIKITMLKPDVVADQKNTFQPGQIARGIMSLTKTPQTSATGTIQSILPNDMEISKMVVSVKMIVYMFDVQTNRVLKTWEAEGTASGKPSISLKNWQAFGDLFIGGANFTQTIAGRAVDKAFVKIGKELNEYFKENL